MDGRTEKLIRGGLGNYVPPGLLEYLQKTQSWAFQQHGSGSRGKSLHDKIFIRVQLGESSFAVTPRFWNKGCLRNSLVVSTVWKLLILMWWAVIQLWFCCDELWYLNYDHNMSLAYGCGQQRNQLRQKNTRQTLAILMAMQIWWCNAGCIARWSASVASCEATRCRHRASARAVSPRRLPWLTISNETKKH